MSRGDNDQIYHDQFVPPPDNVGAASPSGDDSDKSSYNSFEVYDDDDEYIDSDDEEAPGDIDRGRPYTTLPYPTLPYPTLPYSTLTLPYPRPSRACPMAA